ncbi:MAG: right-handed parallel beta-helix repeat-containing protein [Ectothiorhodospiraceae bacterium]|nr:right-handed parallel beta-helix repeat-containing protein [Ectothiorhodospiraceae bacterium]
MRPSVKGLAAARLLVLAMMLAGGAVASAATPGEIAYQGLLSDDGGAPLDGTYDITFALFEAPTGGSAVWSETHDDVTVTAGAFAVDLGSVDSFFDPPTPVSFGRPYWVQITVQVGNGSAAAQTLSPRVPLSSVPYALSARASSSEVTVDCNGAGVTGADVQRAIDEAPIGPLVIDLAGSTCTGNVRIARDDVRIRNGQLVGGTPDFGVVLVQGARRTYLLDLEISGGTTGGNSSFGAGVTVSDGGNLGVESTTIRDNAGDGLTVVENGSVDLWAGAVIRDNGGNGVSVIQNSHLDCNAGAVLVANGGNAMWVSESSSARLIGCVADATMGTPGFEPKGASGVFVNEGSSVRILGDSTVRTNAPGNAAAFAFIGSTLRVRNSGNVIANHAQVPASPLDRSAFALDADINSTIRVDANDSPTELRGSVHSFNQSTVDIRSALITGHVYADGLQTNMRLRSRNSANVNVVDLTKVQSGPGFTAQIVSFEQVTLDSQVEVDGIIDCSLGGQITRTHTNFKDPADGYVNC